MIKKQVVGLLSLMVLNVAQACGPDFPIELTQNRNETLHGLLSGDFNEEAGKLVPKPIQHWAPEVVLNIEWFEPSAENPIPKEQKNIETEGYSPSQLNEWLRARTAPTAQEAFAVSANLPIAHRHYLAGAVAFHDNQFSEARSQFEAILALGEEGRSRLVWAQFMLGRLSKIDGRVPEALSHFEKTRDLANSGAPDPLGLAVTSLGEQAQISWVAATDPNASNVSIPLQQAIELYAMQAAAGSQSGRTSLLFIARKLNATPELLSAGLRIPIVFRLMTSYAFARGFEAMDDDQKNQYAQQAEDQYANPDFSAGVDHVFVTPNHLLDAILQASNSNNVLAEGMDRIAAALYRAGRFDQAGEFAKRQDSYLAHWVLAKLALRSGDSKKAAAEYGKVIRMVPADEYWVASDTVIDYDPARNIQCRARGEAGTLALTQGDFDEALKFFWDAGNAYTGDLSYVAERVLSIEALQQFVDTHAQPVTLIKHDANDYAPEYYAVPVDEQTGRWNSQYPHYLLRSILARRLMRHAQYELALPYFDNPVHRATAKKLSEIKRRIDQTDGVNKAEVLFAAARLIREQGMEIMGFELSPDFAVYDGAYGELSVSNTNNGDAMKHSPEMNSFITASETERLKLSQASPNKRYHYRYVAVKLAEQAADLVPARSQAFAAMLCTATSWVLMRDRVEGERLYKRYLKQGAYVPWGNQFGLQQACPLPEFDRAQNMIDQQKWAERKKTLKKMVPVILSALVLLIGFGAWRRIRKRK